MIGLLLKALLALGPCDPVERSTPDEALAAIYLKVASEEDRLGPPEAAAAAWRIAAALGPPAGAADQALSRLCAQQRAAADFEAGLERFKRGDCREALAPLHAARPGPEGSAAALLEGICALELGDEPRASEALLLARATPQLAATADLYLGLIALRQGDDHAALSRFQGAEKGDRLRSVAAELLRVAGRPERLLVEASLEGGYDSNATLASFSTVNAGGAGIADDAAAAITASAIARPFGSKGPFLSLGGGYRKYARFSQSDVGLGAGSLGWQLALRRVWASIDYGLDFVSLDTQSWLWRQRGTGRVLVGIGALMLSAEYSLRYDNLLAAPAQGYSGLRHAGQLAAGVRVGASTLELSGLFLVSQGQQPERSSVEAGAELRWLLQPSPRWALGLTAGARHRRFDGFDSDLAVIRDENQLDGQVRLEWELTEPLSLFALVEGRYTLSNALSLSCARLAASAGVRISWGMQ